jgi:tetratricopeptide (TPR) repeat protein
VDLGLWEVAGGWECRTLHHGSVGNRTPRPDHWGPTFLDFDPDGRLLASSHLDGVRLWDLAHFREAGHLPNPQTAQVHFHPSGDSLITYGVSGLCRWPIRHRSGSATPQTDGSEALQVGLPQNFDAPGNWLHANVACDRLGLRLLAVDYPHSQALLFDLEQPGKRLVLSQSRVNGCALSPDGRWAFTWSDTASKQYSIHVWSTADGKLVWQPPADERISYFTPDGRWLVTTPPEEAPLRLWELGSWKSGGTLPRPAAKRLSHSTSPDGTVRVTMDPGPPRFYHAATGKELATLEAPRNYGGAAGARFSPDGTWLAVATGNHTIHMWDLGAIHRALAELDLDWELPPYRSPVAKDKPEPLLVKVSAEVTGFLNERDLLLGQEHVQAKKWPEAIESFSQVIERDQTRSDAYHQRGWAHAELQEWPQAAADFAKVVELAPSPAADIGYFRALVCLADDDRDGYRRICARMLEQYGQSSKNADGYWIAWTCALGPGSTADPVETVRLAEKLVTDTPDDFDGPAVLGAALYRAGRHQEAVERLQQADAAYASDKSPQQPLEYTWLFLAMAEHRLGHFEAARTWTGRAVAMREKKDGAMAPAGDAIPWNRRLTRQILYREAEAVLQEPK